MIDEYDRDYMEKHIEQYNEEEEGCLNSANEEWTNNDIIIVCIKSEKYIDLHYKYGAWDGNGDIEKDLARLESLEPEKTDFVVFYTDDECKKGFIYISRPLMRKVSCAENSSECEVDNEESDAMCIEEESAEEVCGCAERLVKTTINSIPFITLYTE